MNHFYLLRVTILASQSLAMLNDRLTAVLVPLPPKCTGAENACAGHQPDEVYSRLTAGKICPLPRNSLKKNKITIHFRSIDLPADT